MVKGSASAKLYPFKSKLAPLETVVPPALPPKGEVLG